MYELPTWEEILESSTNPDPTTAVLALDPGETTGYAAFIDGALETYGQIPTPTIPQSIDPLAKFLSSPLLEYVVVENYQIYPWKLKDHKLSTVYTPRLIGCIETLCYQHEHPLIKQTAQNAKKFATDEKLKVWNMYIKGQPHARDAIRHGIFFLLFGNKSQ